VRQRLYPKYFFCAKEKTDAAPAPRICIKARIIMQYNSGAIWRFFAPLALYFVRYCRSIAAYNFFWPRFYWCRLSINNCQSGRDGTILLIEHVLDNNVDSGNRQTILALLVVPLWLLPCH